MFVPVADRDKAPVCEGLDSFREYRCGDGREVGKLTERDGYGVIGVGFREFS
jgi:hypothetical protein